MAYLLGDGIAYCGDEESRPNKNVLGQYYFLIDVEDHRLDKDIATALERIRIQVDNFQRRGSCLQFTGEQSGTAA